MKKTTLLALVFSVMFTSPSFADWQKMARSTDGDIMYVDFERIRKHEGFVYFWVLTDFLKPDKYGDLSTKTYYQGDCKLFWSKDLSFITFKESMGGGTEGDPYTPPDKWNYPSPNSASEIIMKAVCSR